MQRTKINVYGKSHSTYLKPTFYSLLCSRPGRKTGRYLNCLWILLIFLNSCSRSSGVDLSFLIHEEEPIEYLFTMPFPDFSISERSHVRNRIVELIEKAEHSIDIWAYGFDETVILDSLQSKHNEGVSVRITGSFDQNYSELEARDLSYAIRSKTGLQHAKAIMIDDRILITGTGNFTKSGLFYSHNAFIVKHLTPENSFRLNAALNDEFNPGGILMEGNTGIFTSPFHGRFIQSLILQEILNANHTIHYMIYSFTDFTIARALAIKSQDIPVYGLHNDDNRNESFEPNSAGEMVHAGLRKPSFAGLDGNRSRYEKIRDDEEFPTSFHGGHLHHKTLIIDDTVITGSYNWSASARDRNLEILLWINDARVAEAFRQEFTRVQARAIFPEQNYQLSDLRLLNTVDICFLEKTSEQPSDALATVTFFSGHGPFFQADFYQPESNCIHPDYRHNLSAGLSSGSFPSGPENIPEQFASTEGNITAEYSFVSDSGIHTGVSLLEGNENAPCQNPCIRNHDIDYFSGFPTYIRSSFTPENVYIFHSQGMAGPFDLSSHPMDEQIYYLPEVEGQMEILFFERDQISEYKILRSRNRRSGHVLDFLLWNCIKNQDYTVDQCNGIADSR